MAVGHHVVEFARIQSFGERLNASEFQLPKAWFRSPHERIQIGRSWRSACTGTPNERSLTIRKRFKSLMSPPCRGPESESRSRLARAALGAGLTTPPLCRPQVSDDARLRP